MTSEAGQGSAPGGAEQLPEGAESPPPGVRTMGIVRWMLVALMAVAAGGSWIYWSRADATTAGEQYRCPMHPAVLQSYPGECPVCEMDLVAAGAAGATAVAAPSASVDAPPGGAAQGKYWCPMHPEVASDDPEARCSKCGGMKLLPREPTEAKAAAPAGLVAIDVSAERAQKIGVRTAAVQWQALGVRLRTRGTIRVNEGSVAIVTSRVAGWVEQLRVRATGERVIRGQVLGTLYSPDLITAQQVFLSTRRLESIAQAQPTAAGAAFQTTPEKRLDLLGIAEQDIARIAKDGKVQLALPFRSPIAGYVASKVDAPGAYVEPGTELFRIADLSTVWLEVEVPERDAKRVRVGDGITFFPDVGSGERYTGDVEFVYPAVDDVSGMLLVRAELANEELALRPGMSGDAVLALRASEGLTVPREALVETGEQQYVFVARDGGRFEPRIVRVGARDHDHVQILEGVSEGERVVTTANFLIDSESRLRAAVEAYSQ